MTLFLTSSACAVGRSDINPANRLVQELLRCTNHVADAVYVTSTPDDIQHTEGYGYGMKDSLERIGIHMNSFKILDNRTIQQAEEYIRQASMVILCGGHVPTQNEFMQRAKLPQLMQDFKGVVLGISAGSMNCATWVYAQPEHPGEATNPNYKRFMRGLGLTERNILPHYQEIKHNILDGMRLFEDIACNDSWGHEYYCLPDGSYIYSEGPDHEEVRGECILIADGKMTPICQEEETYLLRPKKRIF